MEDNHFLIDNAPPQEVTYTLLCFCKKNVYSNNDLIALIQKNWGYNTQRNFSFSSRRLFDLGLISKNKDNKYTLTDLGLKIKEIFEYDKDIYFDIMHFLHNTLYYSLNNSRKLFWSYRTCSDILWSGKKIKSNQDLSNEIVIKININWPDLYSSRMGGNFNEGVFLHGKLGLMN